jgi:hypothetical protein
MEQATAEGEPIFVPTICIVEVTYLIEKSRIDAQALARLEQAIREHDSAAEDPSRLSSGSARPRDRGNSLGAGTASSDSRRRDSSFGY